MGGGGREGLCKGRRRLIICTETPFKESFHRYVGGGVSKEASIKHRNFIFVHLGGEKRETYAPYFATGVEERVRKCAWELEYATECSTEHLINCIKVLESPSGHAARVSKLSIETNRDGFYF
jgi:hypothetical protein